MNVIERLKAPADALLVESTGTNKLIVPNLIRLGETAALVTTAETTERGLILMCDAGHLELSWDSENDAAVKLIIERKMAGGMRFFRMQPILGGLVDIKRRIASPQEVADYKIKVKDRDIRDLLSGGNARLFRNGSEEYETSVRIDNAKEVARSRTIGVPALAGG